MVDISPRMNPAIAAIIQKLFALDGASPLNAMDMLNLGAISPGSMYSEQYLSSLYPTPDVGNVALTVTEWLNYLRFLETQFFRRFQQRDVVFFEHKLPNLALLAADAKYELNGQIGPISNGTLVPSLIRSATAYPGAGSTTLTWLVTAAAGWTAQFTVDLNTVTSGSTLRSPQNRVVLLLAGLGDFASAPKVTEYQLKDETGRPLGVHPLPFLHTLNDLNIDELEQSFLIRRNKKLTIDVNFESAGPSIPEMLGVQIQTTDYATTESS